MDGIPEYFAGKEIFITGGSGFVGKVLIEKLLRCCPDLKCIYLLIRDKKDLKAHERVQKGVLDNELFDIIRQNNPEVLKKVIAISGDASELRLGLSEKDEERLLGVHVVFHVAASVRFDEPLKKATMLNTRGTREVMELSLRMPNLEVAVHVSTTYCNTDKDVIEERIYQDHGDWREVLRVTEEFEDGHKLAALTPKYIGKLKNTYLFTKHLAENIAHDYSDRLPLITFRPGVIVNVWKDPIPGWADNINGPIGLNVACGKGFIRVMHSDPDCVLDDMPVDLIVKAMLVATWQRGIQKKTIKEDMPVYNCSMQGQLHFTQQEVKDESLLMISKYPYNGSMWYPSCEFTKNKTLFRIKFFFYNVLLAMIVDTILVAVGRKPMLSKVTRKAYYAIMSVSYFVQRNWDFRCDKFWDLKNKVNPSDRKEFDVSADGLSVLEFMIHARLGTSKYILREKIDIPAALRSHRWLMILHYAFKAVFYGSIMYLLVIRRYLRDGTEGITRSVAV